MPVPVVVFDGADYGSEVRQSSNRGKKSERAVGRSAGASSVSGMPVRTSSTRARAGYGAVVGGTQRRGKRKRGQFAEMRDEVVALGLTQLEGREKRNFNERRVTALGGAAKKRENVPYHILMGMRKKQKQRDDRRHAEEAASGVVLAASQKSKKKKRGGAWKHKDDHDFGLQEMHMTRGGKSEMDFRGGVLYVRDARGKKGRR